LATVGHEQSRKAEVGDDQAMVRVEEDVRGLQVTMNNGRYSCVCVIERPRHIAQH
jgi:hypothetical protein